MIYYIILFISILCILYYFLNIENFSEEIITTPTPTNTSDGSNTKGFYMSMTPNGMNMTLNWFGKKPNNALEMLKWKCSSSLGEIRSIRKNSNDIIECASNDGQNCIKHINNIECINYNNLQNEKLNPVQCVADNLNNPPWCDLSSNILWTCNQSPNGDIKSIRKNSRGVNECASYDGQNCIIHNSDKICKKYNEIKNQELEPYSCAPMSKTNNDSLSYWCASGYKEMKSSTDD